METTSPAASPAHSRLETHPGTVLSLVGVVCVCLSAFLPWFGSFNGWSFLTFSLMLILYGGDYNALFPVLGMLALLLEGALISIFVSHLISLFHPRLPQPKSWQIGVLIVTLLALLGLLWYMNSLNIADEYAMNFGYLVAYGGFLVILLGSLWQVWLARREFFLTPRE